MTIKQIQDHIDEIKSMSGDDEAAHSKEDDLYYGFVDYVSRLDVLNGEDLQEKAALILSTKDIEFARWCA